MNESFLPLRVPSSHSIVNSRLILKSIGAMNLLQILRVAGHIMTGEGRRRPQTSLLSAEREGKGQDGFGLDSVEKIV